MPCKICNQKLFKGDTFSHYWEFHREIMLERIREGKKGKGNRQKHYVHKNTKRLDEFF